MSTSTTDGASIAVHENVMLDNKRVLQNARVKRAAILQSNYIPWKGYFDIIADVDEFILYDDVQFTKNDWRNRNKIKSPAGPSWLTIPVGSSVNRSIRDVRVHSNRWRLSHWKTIKQNYSKSTFFHEISTWLEPIYIKENDDRISDINRRFIEAICEYLGIETRISWSWEHEAVSGQSERLVDLCRQIGAGVYVSGPAARSYLDVALFNASAIDVQWFEYSGYPEYEQPFGEFSHNVSILDLLFCCGPSSRSYMKRPTR